MKLYRNAIILLIVLGLLGGAYVLVKNKKASDNNAQGTAEETKVIKLIEISSDKEKEIIIENKENKLVFEKKDKDWVLTYPTDIKTDKSSISSLATDVNSLNADKVVEENAADLTKYGLQSPSLTVTAKTTDGVQKTVEIGNQTPLKDGYYVKLKDNNKVCTISSYTGDKFVNARNDIKDKKLFEGKPEEAIAFSMEKAGKLVFAAKKLNDTDWGLTSPIEGSVNLNNLSPMIDAVANSSVSEFVEENPSDLSKYGLDKPSYSLECETSKNGKLKLLLGSMKSESSDYYAKLDGKNEVFTIGSSSFNFLDRPLKEMIEVFAYIVNINDVSRIEVDMDGQKTVCELQTDKDDKDKDKFTVNGKDASMKDANDKQPFRSYYQALIGITLSDIEIGTVPAVNSEITFTYYLKKAPGTMKVEFIPKDDKYYYVVKNGKYSNIIVEKKKFDEPEGVRETYKKLMEAVNKK